MLPVPALEHWICLFLRRFILGPPLRLGRARLHPWHLASNLTWEQTWHLPHEHFQHPVPPVPHPIYTQKPIIRLWKRDFRNSWKHLFIPLKKEKWKYHIGISIQTLYSVPLAVRMALNGLGYDTKLCGVFHWGEASINRPLCHKAQISGVLRWWLSFWKFLPSPHRISGAQPELPSGSWSPLLPRPFSPDCSVLARRPVLGRILVVPNFFHLRIMETLWEP